MQRSEGVLRRRAWGCAAPATFPQRVIVIADLGMSYNSSTTMQHVQARPPCDALHLRLEVPRTSFCVEDETMVGYRLKTLKPK